jgi:hypothetical protein
MATSPELRQLCEAWLAAALKLVANRRLYARPDLEIEFGSGVQSMRPTQSVDYRGFISAATTELMDLEQTFAVLEMVQENARISRALFGTDQWAPPLPELGPLMITSHTLGPLLIQYLIRSDYINRTDRVSIASDVFDDVYAQLEQFIFEPETIRVFWLVQFRNLKTEIEALDLSDGIRLRRANEAERKQAVKGSYSGAGTQPGMDIYEVFSNPAFTRSRQDLDTVPDVFLELAFQRGSVRSEDVEAYAEKFLLTLRLIDDVPVSIHSFWYVDTNPFPSIVPPRRVLHEELPFARPEEPYVITPDHAAKIEELWMNSELHIKDPRLLLAVRRLDDSYHRKRPEDRLIDYWVALETLFLQVNEGELRYRASLSIARFLGNSQADRLAICKDVKTSYDLRSKLVHGVVKPVDKLAEIEKQTGSLLRQTLLRCIPKQQTPDNEEILENLLA